LHITARSQRSACSTEILAPVGEKPRGVDRRLTPPNHHPQSDRRDLGPNPDHIVTGGAETFIAVASRRLGPEAALESGALRVEGDREEDREALLAWCRSLVGPAAA
jgi:hypothetical protein